MSQVIMYGVFERFWHWTQAFMMLLLLFTGFNVHGTIQVFNFELAVNIHIITAWCLMALWVLAIFWHFTTGEWKQYIPSSANNLIAMLKFYAIDIFLGGGHPHHKSRQSKLNPVQRMAYLSLHIAISPALWVSGLLYLFYPYWGEIGLGNLNLGVMALIHTAAAFALMAFLVVHLYMSLTTSEKPFAYLKAMISGKEEV